MEDSGGRGFGRGRNTNRSLGKGRGRGRGKRNSTMAAPPSIGESTLPSTTHATPPHCQPTADSTSSHDPLVGQSTPPSTTHSAASHVPSEDIGNLSGDGRMLIRPAPSNEFEPSGIVREIMTIIKSKFVGNWTSYATTNKFDPDLTNMWFNEFKRKFRWLPEHDIQIRKSFDHKASTGLGDSLYRVRIKRDSGTWIPEQNRKVMEQKWKEDAEWKRKAAINSNNRKSSSGPLHTGGSIPSSEHFRRLEKSSEKKPDNWELFEITHKLKNDPTKWVSPVAEKIAVDFETQIAARDSQENEDGAHKKSNDEIYLEVVGGANKKGRIYGLGAEAVKFKRYKATSSHGVSPSEYETMRNLVSTLTEENKKLKGKMETYDEKFANLDRFLESFPQSMASRSVEQSPTNQHNIDDEELEDDLDGI
ncbi:uncharacterized protein LOC130732151 [Lotus japonicus]|uniref:uncharacterized protein LOC130732151 n=1 Tax=Lotus japonicus TaxID=34305 RepID=UPI0025869F40|nr:uncharacterized protein LOC130732151 [Lotus japonicus]